MDKNIKLVAVSAVAVPLLLVSVSLFRLMNDQKHSFKQNAVLREKADLKKGQNKSYNYGSPAEAVAGIRARTTSMARTHSYYFPPVKRKKQPQETQEALPQEEQEQDKGLIEVDEYGEKVPDREETKQMMLLMQETPLEISSAEEEIDLSASGMFKTKSEALVTQEEPQGSGMETN